MHGAPDPTAATGGHYDEGVGTRVRVGPWLLKPGEEIKVKGFRFTPVRVITKKESDFSALLISPIYDWMYQTF